MALDRCQDGREAFERLVSTATDPVAALADVRLVRGLLEQRERELVAEARRAERPWAAIGAGLGISKQAAWERWHQIDPTESEE